MSPETVEDDHEAADDEAYRADDFMNPEVDEDEYDPDEAAEESRADLDADEYDPDEEPGGEDEEDDGLR